MVLSADSGLPESAAELIRDQVNHNRILSAVLVLAAVANAAVIALLAVGFTHRPLTALYVAGAVALFVAAGVVRAYTFTGRLRAAGRVSDERAARVTRKVAEKYGIPVPAVAVLDDDALNALATGAGTNAVVAYTRGLLDELTDSELEAVAAHEVGHIAGRDSRLAAMSAGLLNWALTVGAVISAAAAVIAGIGAGFAAQTQDDTDDPTGGLLRLAFMLVIYLFAAMVFVFGLAWSSVAYLFHMALVRQREWHADALAAQVTGRPDMLAAALVKLRDADTTLALGGRFARSLCIAGEPHEGYWWQDLLDSHPSTGRRIARLLGITSGERDRRAGVILPVIAGLITITFACLLAAGLLHAGPAQPASAAGGGQPAALPPAGTSSVQPTAQQQLEPSPAATPAAAGSGGAPAPITPSVTASPQHSGAATSSSHSPPVGSPPAAEAPATPSNVVAVAVGQYKVDVTWASNSANATGFNVDNGCPVGSCQPGATLTATTGPTTSATFAVTPGTYQCFRVQAFNTVGASAWSSYGCTSTPDLTIPGTQEWTDTGVTVNAGDALGITATGQVYIDPSYPQGPDGDPSCTPAVNYPGQSASFPAPNLACWSLIGRIGTGPPFEVGSSTLVTATSGLLYLGVNDGDFSDNSGNWTVRIKLGGMPPSP